MPTYPDDSPNLTVEALLEQPDILARRLSDIVNYRYVADRVFARGTSDQVAGGSARYQRSESIFPDRNVEALGIRSEYPRTGWSEQVLTAAVKKYGLEVPLAIEAIRRNQLDQLDRALIKLGNAMVKFVDGVAMTMLLTDTDVLTGAASGDWSTAATDIISDVAVARQAVENQNEGYVVDTMIVNPAQELDLLKDADIRASLPREGSNFVSTGAVGPFMGLRQILVSPSLTAGTVLFGSAGIVGTIADEAPDAGEGYAQNEVVDGAAPVYVKVYDETHTDSRVVRAVRWPAMWLAEPKAMYKLTGA